MISVLLLQVAGTRTVPNVVVAFVAQVANAPTRRGVNKCSSAIITIPDPFYTPSVSNDAIFFAMLSHAFLFHACAT